MKNLALAISANVTPVKAINRKSVSTGFRNTLFCLHGKAADRGNVHEIKSFHKGSVQDEPDSEPTGP